MRAGARSAGGGGLARRDRRRSSGRSRVLDAEYEHAKDEADDVEAHVFPGCCIPSVAALTTAVGRASDLRLAGHEDLTPHDARTLRDWRANVDAHRDGSHERGDDERFLHGWEFCLRSCEGGFLGVLPPWMLDLWVNFAPALHHSLGWMRGRTLLGGLGTSYAGARLGALTLHPDVWPSMLGPSAAWTAAMPAALWLVERSDGATRAPAAGTSAA